MRALEFTKINENVYQYSLRCIYCNRLSFFALSKEEYERWVINGEYLDEIFPLLSKEQRENMLSGIHPDCWKQMFPRQPIECTCHINDFEHLCDYCIETNYE